MPSIEELIAKYPPKKKSVEELIAKYPPKIEPTKPLPTIQQLLEPAKRFVVEPIKRAVEELPLEPHPRFPVRVVPPKPAQPPLPTETERKLFSEKYYPIKPELYKPEVIEKK